VFYDLNLATSAHRMFSGYKLEILTESVFFNKVRLCEKYSIDLIWPDTCLKIKLPVGIIVLAVNIAGLIKIQTTSIQNCYDTAKQLSNSAKPISLAEKFVVNVCNNDNILYRAENNLPNFSLPDNIKDIMIKNWKLLFNEVLNTGVNLKIVILPEHSLFDYTIKPANTHAIVQEVLNSFIDQKGFEILDLRSMFDNGNNEVCSLFKDPLHFNNLGKSLITRKIVESFISIKKFATKPDKVTRHNFERVENSH